MSTKATPICPKCGAANVKKLYVNRRVLRCRFCLEVSPHQQFYSHVTHVCADGPGVTDVVPRTLASGCRRVEPHYEGDEP